MCGIFSYSGPKETAGEIVLSGLKRLDYRGYDSWGIALCANNNLEIKKEVGKISEVTAKLSFPISTSAIAHTRWATTGQVNQVNAHPHFSSDKSFALAQNGIVENFVELKEKLLSKNYTFVSETDTEVIVRLLEEHLITEPDFKKAMQNAFLELEGRNTIILLRNNGEILAARNGSPLVVGRNKQTKEIFLSSDTLSFASLANEMLVVDNGQMVTVSNNEVKLYAIETGEELEVHFNPLKLETSIIDKAGYPHFMIKEINESPLVIKQVANQDESQYQDLAVAIKQAHRVYVVGSGTAGFAAQQIAFYLRVYGGVNALSLVGADTQSYYNLFQKEDLIIAPSQSGETADVIEVLEYAKTKGLSIASIVNMPGSMITRMSDYPFMCQAGPEICVMSTKVFIAQIAWGYLLAKTVEGKFSQGREALLNTARAAKEYLANSQTLAQITGLATKLSAKKDIFLLAKYQNLAVINEGMVKLIEGTYKHAHAIPAGDLKHYAITLMEKGVPVVAIVSNDQVVSDLQMAINEVRLRGAQVIAIAHSKKENYDTYLETPDLGETDALINVLPLQLLAYYMAVELGNNVDKPRNIAKSVTVK